MNLAEIAVSLYSREIAPTVNGAVKTLNCSSDKFDHGAGDSTNFM